MQRDQPQMVLPDGRAVRRLRHERGWSPRQLVTAIGDASLRSTGLRDTITPNLLAGIEDRGERIAYDTLCLIAAGFGCDPVDLLPPPD